MYAQTIDGVWFDVGQPFELIKAQATLMQRYDDLPFSYPVSFTSVGDVLHATNAELNGSVKRSVLGSETVVHEGGTVVDSLLMDGCTVESGATVSGSVVGRDVIIPNDTVLDACVVGDGATLVAGRRYLNEKIANEARVGKASMKGGCWHHPIHMSSTPIEPMNARGKRLKTCLTKPLKNASVEGMVRDVQIREGQGRHEGGRPQPQSTRGCGEDPEVDPR